MPCKVCWWFNKYKIYCFTDLILKTLVIQPSSIKIVVKFCHERGIKYDDSMMKLIILKIKQSTFNLMNYVAFS